MQIMMHAETEIEAGDPQIIQYFSDPQCESTSASGLRIQGPDDKKYTVNI